MFKKLNDIKMIKRFDDFVNEKINNTNNYIESKINEYVDVISSLRKTLKPTIEETISKLTSLMMDVSFHGLRADRDWPENKEHDHFMFYILKGKKLLKGIDKLENKVKKIKEEHKLSSEEQKLFNEFVINALNEISYRYPRKFDEELNNFEKEQKEIFINKYNELAKKYNTKRL
jgi:hypothetical protein